VPGNIGLAAAPAMPTLVRLLRDVDPFVRAGAAFALGGIGPSARFASTPFEVWAVWGSPRAPHVMPLVSARPDPDDNVRAQADRVFAKTSH
jgi:HEAT repeat protein